MKNIEYVNCNLCGADDFQLLFTKDNYNIVQCKNCNLIYINPRLGREGLLQKYDGDYSLGYISKEVSKKRRAKRRIKKILKFKKQGKFLDIGCSAGFILEAARKKGFETYGVEVSPHAIKHAIDKLKLNVFEGNLEEANFDDNFFDVITMYEVLEHLPNPTRVLKEIRRVIKNNGLLEISTPDIGHRKAKKLKENWQAIIPEHLYYYCLETLKKMLEKTGFCLFKKQFNLKPGLKIYAKPVLKK